MKFNLKDSGVTRGASNSTPIKDHVPELKNAVPSRAVIAATAEPVSCEAGAMTGVPERNLPRATSGNSVPITEPGSTMRDGSSGGNPRRSSKSAAQFRVAASSICVVLALVDSHTALPVSQ